MFEAALTLFRRDGAEAARIEEIASLAGVSRGTFYFHFPSKDDVLAELMHRSQLEVVEQLAQVPEEAPIRQALGVVAQAVASRWQEDPRLLAELGVVALRNTANALSDTAKVHPLQGALRAYFERAQARGEVGVLIPPLLLSQFFLVNLFGAAITWSGNQVVPLAALLDNVVTFFLQGAKP